MGLHWAWNFLQGSIFSYPEGGATRNGLFTAPVDGPTWLTGSHRKLEGSLIPTIVNLLVTALLLFIPWKRGTIRPAPKKGA